VRSPDDRNWLCLHDRYHGRILLDFEGIQDIVVNRLVREPKADRVSVDRDRLLELTLVPQGELVPFHGPYGVNNSLSRSYGLGFAAVLSLSVFLTMRAAAKSGRSTVT